MIEKRKLQSEIERCLKKVDGGLEIFKETMSKTIDASSENQRDKLQDELKKEIKKLIKLREQIKGWQGSTEVKDKEKLNHYRKLIERQMETFKDVERDFKTKPHSKQGLCAEEKMDPREKERADTLEWLNTQIRKIQDEIDRAESKIESASTVETTKKRGRAEKDEKKVENEKIEEMRNHLERVKYHLQNLEVCMRMITNEKLDIGDVNKKLREPLDMYIDALDSDCDDDPLTLEPDEIYEELGLGDYLSQVAAVPCHIVEEEKPLKILPEPKAREEHPKPKNANADVQKLSRSKSATSNLGQAHVSTYTSPVLAPIVQSISVASIPVKPTRLDVENLPALPIQTPISSSIQRPAAVENVQTSLSSIPSFSIQRQTVEENLQYPALQQRTVGSPQSTNIQRSSTMLPYNVVVAGKHKTEHSSRTAEMPVPISSALSVLDSPEPMKTVKLDFCFAQYPMKSKRPDPTPQRPHSNPEASFNSVVLPNVFTERSHLPNTPTCDAPSWYPRMLCCGPPSVEYFLKLELGTMLFSFYYMEGTRAQYLAAKALKNLSWRFHTRYLMWFQRVEDPIEITDTFEQGRYVYFDYQTWGFLIAKNFKFEYKYLEDYTT